MITEISSASNAHFKRWKSLLEPSGMKKEKCFFVFGEKVVQEILRDTPEHCLSLVESPTTTGGSFHPVLGIQRFRLKAELFRELDIFGTKSRLLIAKLPSLREWSGKHASQGLEVFLPLGDPGNLGTAIRSSLAFGASRIVLLQEAANPFHPKTLRAISMNPFYLNLWKGPSIEKLCNESAGLLALDGQGKSLPDFSWPKKARLLLGEEGRGLPSNFPKNQRLKIPISPHCESLNASMALGIGLFHYRLRHPLAK